MLNIILITPVFAEMETPAGICAEALAEIFTQHGFNVHVICAAGTTPRPGYECKGGITIHRLTLRHDATEHAFAVQACKRALELFQAEKCDVIECIDSPTSVMGVAAMRSAKAIDAPLVSIVADPALHKTSLSHAHQHAADAHVDIGDPALPACLLLAEPERSCTHEMREIVSAHRTLWSIEKYDTRTQRKTTMWRELEMCALASREMETIVNDNQSLEILVEQTSRAERFVLKLSDQSCWANFFGQWPLPCEGAIDKLDAFFRNKHAQRVTLRGCPSACVLPLLWIRSIWFPDGGTELVIDWTHIDDPSDAQGRQPAGKLACILADRVRCDDPQAAWQLWGIDVSDISEYQEEAFDLLTHLIDIWDTDLAYVNRAAEWNESVRHAIGTCAAEGKRRIGIYGAGTHTRAVSDALMEPNAEIVCIIDDDARRNGQHMWGYEIVSRERALALDLDAVIISANSIEDKLWDLADVFRQRGITTTRLYGSNIEVKQIASGQDRAQAAHSDTTIMGAE